MKPVSRERKGDTQGQRKPQMITAEKVTAALKTLEAVATAIKLLERVPNGELYAHLMGRMTIQEYTTIIDLLKRSTVIREENNVLIWNIKEETI